MKPTAAVILAAGKSTRMRSDLPKVLHEVCGRPMLSYVIDACRELGVVRLIVVIGHRHKLVTETYADAPDLIWVYQAEQRGTGHAVMVCSEALAHFAGSVLVIAGDMPLIRSSTLRALVAEHERTGHAVTLATTVLDNPHGYGRIVRDPHGNLAAIVEHKDCTAEQLQVREVNPSYYCFDGARWWVAVGKLTPANAQGEYYITDTVEILRREGLGAGAIPAVPQEDALGINSRADLAEVNRVMQDRIQRAWMEWGVSICDPRTTWIEHGASIGRETVIAPFSFIASGAVVGESCRLGPFAYVRGDEVIPSGAVMGPVTGWSAQGTNGGDIVAGGGKRER
ncbi:MAG: NTP transferase domain-containing protein [Planctomycetota bacterium]